MVEKLTPKEHKRIIKQMGKAFDEALTESLENQHEEEAKCKKNKSKGGDN